MRFFIFINLFILIVTSSFQANATLVQNTENPWAGFHNGGDIGEFLITSGGARPHVVDWDSDGDLDFLIGGDDGTITLYIQNGPGNYTETKNLGGIDVGSKAAPRAVDWDGQNGLDLVIGNSAGEIKLYLRNANGTFAEDTQVLSGIDVGSTATPDVFDLNNDSDWDLFVGNYDGTFTLFQNNGSNVFTETANFAGLDVGAASAPHVIDIDGDGDLDILTGQLFGFLTLYTNTGGGNYNATSTYAGVDLSSISLPYVIDMDGDTDLDIVVGSAFGEIKVFSNDGAGNYTQTTTYPGIDSGSLGRLIVVDFDDDNDQDLILADGDTEQLVLYTQTAQNTFSEDRTTLAISSAQNPVACVVDAEPNGGDNDLDFILGHNGSQWYLSTNNGSDVFTSLNLGFQGFPETSWPNICVDFDSDGDIDVIAGSIWGNVHYAENTGGFGPSGTFTIHEDYFGIATASSTASPFWVDWDDDGDKDFVIGNGSGTFSIYVNDGSGNYSLSVSELDGLKVGGAASPQVLDWDGDGDLDILSGSLSGRVFLFETDNDGDGYVGSDDCDDSQAAVNQFTVEICGDGLDNDCDGNVDTPPTWYQDQDGDGYGNAAVTQQSCTQPIGYVSDNTDCDDTNAINNPGATEVCDGIDNTCDGFIDENIAISTTYRDADGDGFGDDNDTQNGCAVGTGYIAQSGDCDDSNANINPSATENCGDGVDNDCNGQADLDDSACSQSGATGTDVPATCGNGTLDSGEECDDGNLVSGDGCSDACVTEVTENSTSASGSGSVASGSSSGCSLASGAMNTNAQTLLILLSGLSILMIFRARRRS